MSDSSDPTATPERYSPLHAQHVAAGASFTDFAGWQMPVRYSSDLAEHHAVRTAAGLFDLSHMAEIVILGPEAADALDYALAGRISAVADSTNLARRCEARMRSMALLRTKVMAQLDGLPSLASKALALSQI